MASFLGRTGRRRRVLNEEVLSASSSHMALRAMADESSDTGDDAPRYSEAADVENHPPITDFVPRRYRTLWLLTVLGMASVAGLAALDHWAASIAGVLGMRTTAPLDFAAPGSLAAWMAAVLLLGTCAACLLVYSLRRHRIDDFRGRYRVWLAAAAVCLLLSVNSVASLHRALADAASYHTGWWALREGAIWWLALAALPVAWVIFRTLADVSECRLAASTLTAAVLLYLVALANHLGWRPIAFEPRTEPLLTVGLTLGGHWLVLTAVVSYARYVVLDAQGLTGPRPRRRAVRAKRQAGQRATVSQLPAPARTTPPNQPQLKPAAEVDPSQWVDGRQPERDDYEDDEPDRSGRKLSKAERKRLRKLKTRSRAA